MRVVNASQRCCSALPVALLMMAVLSGCGRTVPPTLVPEAPSSSPPSRLTGATMVTPANDPEATAAPILRRGSGIFTQSPGGTHGLRLAAGGDVELNFINTDIRVVADAVLGEMLGLAYSIDPKLQGAVTVRAVRPIPRDQLLGTFDTILREHGAALVTGGTMVQVVSLAEAPGAFGRPLPLSRTSEVPGYSTAIVPVRHISIKDMRRLLEPVVRQGLILQADPVRNIFIIGGSPREIETFGEAVASFDVDWLSGMSFGLFPLRAVDPERLERELTAALALKDGPLAEMVELIPVSRLSALLVAARQPQLLDRVAEMIRTFDRSGVGSGRGIHVYEVQYGSADALAGALKSLIGTGDSMVEQATEGPQVEQRPLPDSRLDRGRPAPVNGGNATDTVSEYSDLRFVADMERNALIVFASAEQFRQLQGTLERLDTPREQVMIEATIAEVSLTDDLNFGVQWFFDRGNTGLTFSAAENGQVSPSYPGFGFTYFTPSTRVVLSALSSLTDVQVLSAPRLMVLNNQTARLQVGDQVPIITRTATGIQDPDAPIISQVELRDTGVILEVTPRINRNGLVALEVKQEISDVVETTTSTINSPTIQQRRITSTVSVRDGETVALGGLISERQGKGRTKVPVLGDIPFLGHLFSTDRTNVGKTELIVFLRPVVVRDSDQARSMTEALRSRMLRLKDFVDATGNRSN